AEHNLRKFASPVLRGLARLAKAFDVAAWSFAALERRQYLGPHRPVIVVNSRMVRGHFAKYYGIGPERVRVLPSAVNPDRLDAAARPRRRAERRQLWGVEPDAVVGLCLAMNYRLKGLAPLLRALPRLPRGTPFRLLVAGHPNFTRYRRLARRLGVSE